MFNIFLSIITSISSLGTIANSNEIKFSNQEIDKSINKILTSNIENYSYNTSEDLIKTNLLFFFDNSSYVENKNNLTELKTYLKNNDYTFKNYGDGIEQVSLNNRLSIEYKIPEGSFSEEKYTFEKIDGEFNDCSFSYLNSISGDIFIGVNLTKDLAISIYNLFFDVLTTINDTTLFTYIETNLIYSVDKIALFVQKVYTKVSSIIKIFINSIPSNAIGFIIKSILCVIVCGASLFLLVAFIFGFFNKGFYFGFRRYSFNNRKIEYGLYE